MQPLDVLGRAGQPGADPHRGVVLVGPLVEQGVDQDVRAELAGPHPDAVLGRQGRRHEVAVEPVDGEGDDRAALGVVAEDRVGRDAVDAAQAVDAAAR